jgi:hypothetical protein
MPIRARMEEIKRMQHTKRFVEMTMNVTEKITNKDDVNVTRKNGKHQKKNPSPLTLNH